MSARIDNWNELRAAYVVARTGKLSAAAEELGVHHTTVLRQVAALERKLGTTLFHRHARGYAPTEAGRLLMQTAEASEDQFRQVAARIADDDRRVSGKIIVTAFPELSPVIVPILAGFREAHPDVNIELKSDERRLALDYGEAHVGLRAGPPPSEPDNVAQRLVTLRSTFYAHRDYIARHGRPASLSEEGHWFVTGNNPNDRVRTLRWVAENIPPERIAFRGSGLNDIYFAVLAGMGIGTVACWAAARSSDLVPIVAPEPEWSADLWLVTHVDLHRTAKVQALLSHIKGEVARISGAIDGSEARASVERYLQGLRGGQAGSP